MIHPKDILYEDNHLIVVNKRCGDLVQPDRETEEALENDLNLERHEYWTCASFCFSSFGYIVKI